MRFVAICCKSNPLWGFKKHRKGFGDLPLDPELYKVKTATSENNRIIQLLEVTDKGKIEYIVSHPDNFELGSWCINRIKLEKNAQSKLMKEYFCSVIMFDTDIKLNVIVIMELSFQWY